MQGSSYSKVAEWKTSTSMKMGSTRDLLKLFKVIKKGTRSGRLSQTSNLINMNTYKQLFFKDFIYFQGNFVYLEKTFSLYLLFLLFLIFPKLLKATFGNFRSII